MPKYLSILREVSVDSIYALFVLVLLFAVFKGWIKNKEFRIVFYVWLPIAVVTQFLMTYFRIYIGKSNLPIMNIYLMIEFTIFVSVLVKANYSVYGKKINYKIWALIIFIGIALHFLDRFDTIHNSAMLFIALVYFQLSVNFIDLNKIDELIKDPLAALNVTIFIMAFGYSYFLIYQTDYTFPLSIYSGVNLLVQISFAITLVLYYKSVKLNS
jgi:hypothetical protein